MANARTRATYFSDTTLGLDELFSALFVGNSQIVALAPVSVELNGAIAII
jgi:hypothetical protein